MSILLGALAEQLAAAAEREATRRAASRRRHRVTAIVATGGLTLGGAAAIAATVWQPELGDGGGHPTASASAPPPAQLFHLGVLRRAATAGDHGAQSTYALRFLDPSLRGVRIDFVRLLGTDPTLSGFVLMPVQAFNVTGRVLPDGLCLFAADSEAGGLSCFSTAQLFAGQAIVTSSKMTMIKVAGAAPAGSRPRVTMPDGSAGPVRLTTTVGATSFAGLVPDGVASVRVTNDLGSITVPAHDNFFQARMPADAAHAAREPRAADQPTFQWLDASGVAVTNTTGG